VSCDTRSGVKELPKRRARAEAPRREGRRLSAALRAERAQRREFHEALLDADSFEDLPGKWQAAILEAEQNRPKLRVV
jgi:hypothetical protein